MIENISISCGSVTLNAGSENFGVINADVTLTGDAKNSGTVNGNLTLTDTAVNNGTVSGSVTNNTNEGLFQAWLFGVAYVSQYTGPGERHGTWAYNGTIYVSEAAALAAQGSDFDGAGGYAAWLAANTGVNQFIYPYAAHNGQWAYYSTEYASQADAVAAQTNDDALSSAFANDSLTAVRQYTGAGSQYNRWAYYGTFYDSQAEAEAAFNSDEGTFSTQLSSNANTPSAPPVQYTGRGYHYGTWTWCGQSGTQEEMQAAYNAYLDSFNG